MAESTKSLVSKGTLSAGIRVPDAAGAIDVEADLHARQFTASTDIGAPKTGRPQTRINWLLRQIRDATLDLVVEARYPNARLHPSLALDKALEHPEDLLYPGDAKREPRSFSISYRKNLGRKKGKDAGSFVGDSSDQIKDFYRDVLQRIRAWQPPAPKLREAPSVDGSGEEPDGATISDTEVR
jgi:hypothetical protein